MSHSWDQSLMDLRGNDLKRTYWISHERVRRPATVELDQDYRGHLLSGNRPNPRTPLEP